MKVDSSLWFLIAVLTTACFSGETTSSDEDFGLIDPMDTVVISDTLDADTTDQTPKEEPIDTIYAPPADLISIEGAIHFYVIGDFGRRGEFGQIQVGRMMDTVSTILPPDFIVSTGDNFYPDGVSSITDSHWRESFEDIYSKENGLNSPWYVVLGNHDYHIDPNVQIAYTEVSDRWTMPDFYYHKDFEKASTSLRMIFLDTNPFIDKLYNEGKFKNKIILQDTAYRLHWMDSLLSDDSWKWKIVVGHHPIHAGGDDGSEIRSMKNNVESHLKNKANIYLNGHVHMTYHAKPEGQTTHYITSGTGSKTESGPDIPGKIFSSPEKAFLIASVTSDSIYCQVVTYKGKVEYRTSVK